MYLADCVELMYLMSPGCVGSIFADPPYRLSGGGVTVKSGGLASVDKGDWAARWARTATKQRVGVLGEVVILLYSGPMAPFVMGGFFERVREFRHTHQASSPASSESSTTTPSSTCGTLTWLDSFVFCGH